MQFRKRFVFAIAAFACGLSALASAQTVSIETGKLQGATRDGITSYKGIPYAAPPVGKLRWRAPQPAEKWSGIRQATEYGHDCMQLPFSSDAAPLGTKPAEDCLVANVWRPALESKKTLPVMVWIYGGGFVNGGSSPAVYDGSEFAREGIVFVSFNYRLGRFGFFAHPALDKENADGVLGNYGYMDQIAALKWVQRNIAAFGGDPKNVTLFGESAGGMSTHTMLTSPLSQGLFQRAIVESGGGRSGLLGRTKEEANKIGVAFAASKGIAGEDAAALDKLRALPADAVVDGLNMATMFSPTYSGAMTDGKLAVEGPDAAYLAGHQPKVPVIVGANSMEIGFSFAKSLDEVFAQFGANAEKARAAFDPQKTSDFQAVSMAVASEGMMVEPARFVAAALAPQQPTWEYRFSYVADSMLKEWKGAPHATEIPFVFDTVKARYEATLTAKDEKAARQMHEYWVNFAKTGDPNGAGLPIWPKYDKQADQLMNFTEDGAKSMADPWKDQMDLLEATHTK